MQHKNATNRPVGATHTLRVGGYCHAADGPPKIGPPGPSVAIFIATGGPPGPSTAAIDGLPGPSMAP